MNTTKDPTATIRRGRGGYTASSRNRKKKFHIDIHDHHIIPYSLRNHEVFKQSAFPISSMDNRILLPKKEYASNTSRGIRVRAVHNGWNKKHSEYNKMVKEELDRIQSNFPRLYWPAELEELMLNLRHALRDGTINLA